MSLTCGSVCNHCCKKRLYGAKDGNGKCRRDKTFDRLEIEMRRFRLRHRQPVRQFRELRADGGKLDSCKLAQKHRCYGSYDQSDQRAGYFLCHLTPAETYHQTYYAHCKFSKVDAGDVIEIACPLGNESCRHFQVKRKTEEILHLSGKYRQGDTAGESDHYRIRYELEYHTHLAQSHHHEKYSRHNGGDDEALHSVLADDAGHNHNESTCRAAYKEVGTSKE